MVQAKTQHPLPQPTYLCLLRYDLPFRWTSVSLVHVYAYHLKT